MKKTLVCVWCIIFALLLCAPSVSASVKYPVDAPYETYIYNSDDQPMAISAAFNVERTVSGKDLSDTEFSNLSDIFYSDNRIFICDTDNNRIVITDKNWNSIGIVSAFDYNGNSESLNKPTGVWADSDDFYVSDTGNSRIVIFNINDGGISTKKIFDRPDISSLGKDYVYAPSRLTVDSTGRMYVITSGVNQGLVCLDENGKFKGFLGAPQVEPNFLETIWRKIATKEQLSRMDSYVPTEYNAVTMDAYGFLYVASKTSNTVPAGKLNSDGDNVMPEPKLGDYGDLNYLKDDSGYAPYFTDIALFNSGRIGEDIYYLIDSKQGKIYSYTEDGYLLYAFGANGSQKGTFYNATAIEYIPGDNGGAGSLVVTDSSKGTITVLHETEFSLNVRNALSLYNQGQIDKSKEAWEQVSRISSNYILATIGLAKIELEHDNYYAAMKKLKTIREYDLYADAFESYRDNFIRNNFPLFVVTLFALVGVFILCKVLKRKKFSFEDSETCRAYKYGSYVMLHPFDGFWDLKNEKRGNAKSATIIAALFFVIYALNAQFGGYVVTKKISEETNALYSTVMLFLPLLFWIIANWCFTTLMDGKGTMKDIYIATCYALKPYVIFGIPLLILSNVLTQPEIPFYTFFNTLVLVWVLFLLIAGLMMTHDYSLSKTVLTVILILIGICLIIFILLLIVSIVQNIYQFAFNTYQELSFRSY